MTHRSLSTVCSRRQLPICIVSVAGPVLRDCREREMRPYLARATQCVFGPRGVIAFHICLFVVALWPSRMPARAARPAPLQTARKAISHDRGPVLMALRSTYSKCVSNLGTVHEGTAQFSRCLPVPSPLRTVLLVLRQSLQEQ
jgi:hypothetical protein